MAIEAILALCLAGASLITGTIGAINQRKTAKETNEINQSEYEDWKQYTDYESTLDRAQKAGVSPFAALGQVSSPSSPYVNDNISQTDPFSNMSSLFQSLTGTAIAGINASENRKLKAAQTQANVDYHNQLIKLQEETAKTMAEYRNSVQALNEQIHQENVRQFDANYRWRNDYYLNPHYAGYWQTNLSSQNYQYNYQRYPLELYAKSLENIYAKPYYEARNYGLNLLNEIRNYAAGQAEYDYELRSSLFPAQKTIAELSADTDRWKHEMNNTGFFRWFGLISDNIGKVLGMTNQLSNSYLNFNRGNSFNF